MPSALRCAALCTLALPALAGVRTAVAQSSTPPSRSTSEAPYVAALAAEQLVRAGADVRYYPFGHLRAGDVVMVVGTKAGFARVATSGPAFSEFFGFVKVPKAGTSHLRRGADGRSATTTGPTDIFAPNLDAKQDAVASSWKPVVTLGAEREVVVLETTETDQEIIYRVALPSDGEGWVDLKGLRAATASESAVFEAAVHDAPQRPLAAARPEVVPKTLEPAARASVMEPPMGPAPAPAGPPAPAPGTSAPRTAPVLAAAVPGPGPASVPAAVDTPQRSAAQAMLEDLEAAYAKLAKEPIETAEVNPLRQLYLDLAVKYKDSRTIARFAQTRARQLALWAEIQQQRGEMKGVLNRSVETQQSAIASKQVIDGLGQYLVVGRLDASTLYDGQRLPKLLRIRDPKTGRTIAYVQPDPTFELATLLGREVGVMGEWAEDPGLRVNLIVARKIDPL